MNAPNPLSDKRSAERKAYEPRRGQESRPSIRLIGLTLRAALVGERVRRIHDLWRPLVRRLPTRLNLP